MTTSTDEKAARITEIRAALASLAPWPDSESAGARQLATWALIEAQIAWSRLTSMECGITKTDIAIVSGYFGTAHALLAFAGVGAIEVGPDDAAAQIRDAWDDAGGVGEWIWEHLAALGLDPRAVSKLTTELASLAGEAR